MLKKVRRLGKVKPATVEKTGKPGKPEIVKKRERVVADPEFVKFFSADYKSDSEWDKLLDAVEIPGMEGASWDRKAAYLYWCLRQETS